MKQFGITLAAYAATVVFVAIPVMHLLLANWFRARFLRKGTSKESGMTFGEIEMMSDVDLDAYLCELATCCPIELPRYCCPIIEFRKLGSQEVEAWIDNLHRREKLALAARHYGCVKWNQRF